MYVSRKREPFPSIIYGCNQGPLKDVGCYGKAGGQAGGLVLCCLAWQGRTGKVWEGLGKASQLTRSISFISQTHVSKWSLSARRPRSSAES